MGNSASALPYSIDAQVGAPHDHNGWAFHDGKSASDGSEVSVFVGKKPVLAKTPASPRFPSKFLLTPAYHHYQNCRKLRHPNILKVYATLDTDNPNAATTEGATSSESAATPSATTGDLIVVTEKCQSLDQWLLSNPSPEQLAWGLECIVRGLHFLHSSANLAHGNISPSSFYVTPAGDVKLWNFSLITPVGNNLGPTNHFQEWEIACTPDAYRSPERVERRFEAISAAGVHCMDSYALGILIDHWFSGRIPQPLVKAVQRLQTANLKMRPRLQPLLKCPVFDTPYQKINLQLDELNVQPVEQKIATWQNILSMLQNRSLQKPLAVYKVLPLIRTSVLTICGNEAMLAQDYYRKEVLAMMGPLFFIADNFLTGEEVGNELKPLVGLLFVVKDRGVRGSLLSKIDLMAANLDKKTLNASVFEPMCSGFSDSSPALREMTLKSCVALIPSLNPPNVEKLSRYLIRLQSDNEASIRANTVIFVSKLAPQLSDNSRKKILLPAFVRAMKDAFPPCRLAAVQAVLKSRDNFSLQEVATQVMPALTPVLMDPMEDVRKEAFSVVDGLLVELRRESDRMAHTARTEAAKQPQNQPTANSSGGMAGISSAGSGVAPAPSSGSYLSGISSWMATSTQPTSNGPANPVAPPPAPASQPRVTAPPAPAPPVQQFGGLGLSAAPAVADDDGWGDEDDNWGDDSLNNVSASSGLNATPPVPVASQSDGWGDDSLNNFSASSGLNAAPTSMPQSQSAGFRAPGAAKKLDDDDPFAAIGMSAGMPSIGTKAPRSGTGGSKLVVPKKAPLAKKVVSSAPATKLAVDDDDGFGDGWDDF